jgi:MoxR-like ATPase
MKIVKDYRNFSDEYRLNENLLKKAWDSIYGYFEKKFKQVAWLYYMLFLKKNGTLEKLGVSLYVPYEVDGVPSDDEVGLDMPNESLTISRTPILNEANVDLTSSDPNKPDVDAKLLRQSLENVWAENEDRVEQGAKRADNSSTLFIWGAPGIGKTAIVNQFAKEKGMVVEVMLLSQFSPEDFKGVPRVEAEEGSTSKDDERTVFKLPRIFPKDNCPNNRGGILFFDEMNQANKFVLGAAMTLCLDGTIGKYELPEHWIIVAAGNRKEDVGEGGRIEALSKPLAGRFTHVNYAPKKEDWIEHVINKPDMNPDVITFIEFQPEWLFKMDSDNESDLYPSPRSWVRASHSDYIRRGKDWKNKISEKELRLIYDMNIGTAATSAFISYLKLREQYNEKDVADVYKKGKNAKKLPARPDLGRAAAIAIALYKKGDDLTVEDLKNVYDFALDLPDFEAMTSLLNYFNWIHPEVKKDPKFKDIVWDGIRKWNEIEQNGTK